MDFRGGDYGQSSYGRELVAATRAGQTRGQQDRNLRQRIMLAAAQAALMGIGGGLSAKASKDEEDAREEAQLRKGLDQFHEAGSVYEGSRGEVPAWLGRAGEGDVSAIRGEGLGSWKSPADDARLAIQRNKTNDLVANSDPNSPQFQKDADSTARDLQTGLAGMQTGAALSGSQIAGAIGGGGMMGSVPPLTDPNRYYGR